MHLYKKFRIPGLYGTDETSRFRRPPYFEEMIAYADMMQPGAAFQDAAREVPVSDDFDPIMSLTDFTSYARHWAPPSLAQRPIKLTLNNKPCVNFYGVDTHLAQTLWTLAQDQPTTVYYIGAPQVKETGIVYDGVDQSFRNALYTVAGAQNLYDAYALAELKSNTGTLSTVEHVIAVVFNTTSSAIYNDSLLLKSGNIGTFPTKGFMLGGRYNSSIAGTVEPVYNKLRAFAAYDGAHDADKVAEITTFFNVDIGILSRAIEVNL